MGFPSTLLTPLAPQPSSFQTTALKALTCLLDACQVGQWFTQRALEVDTRSGQLTWSGALLRLFSRADALQGVKDMQEAVSSLREIAQPGGLAILGLNGIIQRRCPDGFTFSTGLLHHPGIICPPPVLHANRR